MLSILKQHKCFNFLPLDCRTILHSTSSKITSITFVKPGHYFHFGLKNGIENCSKRFHIKSDIKIVIGIDGLPLTKSSSSQFWPILAYVHPFEEYIFLIGLYHGLEKPADSNEFLKDFISEAEYLVKNGIDINDNKKISIFTICADAPAKSFVMKTKDHAGYYSCTRYFIEGEFINN